MTLDIVETADRLAWAADDLVRVATSVVAARTWVVAWPPMLSASRAYVERVSTEGLRRKTHGVLAAMTPIDAIVRMK